MKRLFAKAERLSELSLALLGAINLLFVLFFLAVLLLATGRARAEEVACEGTDLVRELEESDPDLLQQARDEAANTPNGSGLLWRIEGGEGKAPSFLFGTMHVSDPRVTQLPAAAQVAFDAAGTIAIEMTDILDDRSMMAVMAQSPELMMFPPGEDLTDYLTAEEEGIVSAALDARGVPLSSIVKMQPWMLGTLLTLPPCELQRKDEGAPVLDEELALEARAAGKRLVGLESAEEQLSAMATVPIGVHIRGLISVLRMGRLEDIFETMIGVYRRGEVALLVPSLKSLLPAETSVLEDYAVFEETLVTARNRRMAERATPLIKEGGAFIAVGAMHLPGEEGLVELLRKAGYTVSRAD